jgi:hypothetical protein
MSTRSRTPKWSPTHPRVGDVSEAREEGSLVWRIEHSVCPPALAPLLDEVKNTLLAIYAEAATDPDVEGMQTIQRLVVKGLKG